MRMTNRLVPIAGMCLAFSIAATVPAAFAQAQQPPAQQQQPADRDADRDHASAQTARGQLLSVDAASKMITIKPMEGAEQRFQYTDDTRVTGERGGVAGLATMSGRDVVVHFTTEGAARVATSIEIQADEPAR